MTAAPRRGRQVLLAAAVGVVLLAPTRAALAQPDVTATTSCSPDESASYQLTVSGTEFPPQAQVTVTFTAVGQADPAAQPDDQNTTSNAAGAFAVQQTVQVGQTAAFTVQAASGATVASKDFDVPACPLAGETTTSTTIVDQADQVTLSPTAGVPGTVVQVTGRDFQPGARLRLRWDRGLGEATVTVGPVGTFVGQLLIFRKDVIGPRRLLIEAAEPGAEAAPTTTTVEPGAGVDEEDLTFLVLPARQSPAVYGPASQVR